MLTYGTRSFRVSYFQREAMARRPLTPQSGLACCEWILSGRPGLPSTNASRLQKTSISCFVFCPSPTLCSWGRRVITGTTSVRGLQPTRTQTEPSRKWLYAQDALRAALVEAGVFGDARERYITQKASGYSKLVSNIARAPSGADKVSQVRTLSRAFIADHDLEGVAIAKLGLRRVVRAALLLLRLEWVHMLLVAYALKERGSGRR